MYVNQGANPNVVEQKKVLVNECNPKTPPHRDENAIKLAAALVNTLVSPKAARDNDAPPNTAYAVQRPRNGWNAIKKEGGLDRTALKAACRERQIEGFGKNTHGVEDYKALLIAWENSQALESSDSSAPVTMPSVFSKTYSITDDVYLCIFISAGA